MSDQMRTWVNPALNIRRIDLGEVDRSLGVVANRRPEIGESIDKSNRLGVATLSVSRWCRDSWLRVEFGGVLDESAIAVRWEAMNSTLDERGQRRWCAAEARPSRPR